MNDHLSIHEDLKKQSEDVISKSERTNDRVKIAIIILAISGLILSIIGAIVLFN